ncbi:hypothetical protein DY000_02048256 [Brassica cretica]|uniref:Uncharacterized protein n=1 Tax=Brassica cretica TaxID=69181 RepID=A0ABQ7EWC4_BRACR|nr:hypothetical protein DY000_02048256 [Brassica cretica]
MKNRSRNLDGQTQAKHTGILQDRKIRDLFLKESVLTSSKAGFLLSQQASSSTTNPQRARIQDRQMKKCLEEMEDEKMDRDREYQTSGSDTT